MTSRLAKHLDNELAAKRAAKVSAIVTDDDVMDVDQCAEFLNTPKRTIQQLAARGELPGRKVGRRWQFLRSRIIQWMDDV